MVTRVVITDAAPLVAPANALALPKLSSFDYRLYPVVDQLADKICATFALYSGQASSREKDLVDLVVLAVTQDVIASKLIDALRAESRVRRLTLPAQFDVPARWGAVYSKLASDVPACTNFPTVEKALTLMRLFLDSVLNGQMAERTWDHLRLEWVLSGDTTRR